VVGRGERGAGVGFLEGPPWWEAMSVGGGGDARPSSEDEMYGREDRVQNDVVLRNVGGGKEGSGSVSTYCDLFFIFIFYFYFYFLFLFLFLFLFFKSRAFVLLRYKDSMHL